MSHLGALGNLKQSRSLPGPGQYNVVAPQPDLHGGRFGDDKRRTGEDAHQAQIYTDAVRKEHEFAFKGLGAGARLAVGDDSLDALMLDHAQRKAAKAHSKAAGSGAGSAPFVARYNHMGQLRHAPASYPRPRAPSHVDYLDPRLLGRGSVSGLPVMLPTNAAFNFGSSAGRWVGDARRWEDAHVDPAAAGARQ